MRKIRLTINPEREIEVDEAEYLDLKRQGLIHEEIEDKPAEPEPKPAEEALPAEPEPEEAKPVTKARGTRTNA